ncbi:MAG: hypothetical protein VYB77_09040, partial [Planctomycetota bacterium]|nr:hypothetical protein [Planctomycetota bacterium]
MHGECCDSVHRNLAPREGAPLSQPADQSPDRPADPPADRRLEQHVLAELAAWRDLPGGGGRAGRSVRDQLERTIKASKPLGGPLAEARVARRLLRTGCDIA